MNKANGICPVFCGGKFDPTKSGHMVLPQLGVLIEFLPGTLILLPPATLVHGNATVQPGETWDSLTFFTAGGLFRWIAYDFQKEKDFQTNNPAGWANELQEQKTRWRRAVNQFSMIHLIDNDR